MLPSEASLQHGVVSALPPSWHFHVCNLKADPVRSCSLCSFQFQTLLAFFCIAYFSITYHNMTRKNMPHIKQWGCRNQSSLFSMSLRICLLSYFLSPAVLFLPCCKSAATIPSQSSMSCLDLQSFAVLRNSLNSFGSHVFILASSLFIFDSLHTFVQLVICLARALSVRPVVSKQPKSSASWELCSMRSWNEMRIDARIARMIWQHGTCTKGIHTIPIPDSQKHEDWH